MVPVRVVTVSTIELAPDAMPIVEAILDRRAAIDDLNEELDELTDLLKIIVGDNTEATIGGRVVLTWKSRVTSRLDQKRLKAEQPEIYAAYVKSDASRVWRWSK